MNPSDIKKGHVPCLLWHYIGTESVSPYRLTDNSLFKALTTTEMKVRNITVQHVIAVLVASQAINRMMGQSDKKGMYILLPKTGA